jgi:hypothetical protein
MFTILTSIDKLITVFSRLESNELSGPLPDYTGSYFLPAEIGYVLVANFQLLADFHFAG